MRGSAALRIKIISATALVVTFFLNACAGVPFMSDEKPTVRIAVIEDLEIPDSLQLVSPVYLALQSAIDPISDELPVWVRVDHFDTRGDSAEALRAARDVIADPEYIAVVVAPFMRLDAPAERILSRADIPVFDISMIDEAPSGENARSLWLSMVPSADVYAASFTRALHAAAGSGKPCLTGSRKLSSRWLTRRSSALLKPEGEVLGFPGAGEEAMAMVGRQARAHGCSALGWTGFSPGAAALRLATAGDSSIPLVGWDGIKTSPMLADNLKLPGRGRRNAVLAVCGCADVTLSVRFRDQRFIHDYQSWTGLEPGIYAAEAWDVGRIITVAIASGDDPAAAVRDAVQSLRNSGYQGVARSYVWSDGVPNVAGLIFKAQGLRWVSKDR